MSDYHGRIMNIERDPSVVGQMVQCQPTAAYVFGHRDARHAAAEIVCEADKALREKDAEIARLREALGTFMEWWDTESAGPQYSADERRNAPDGEREWNLWWSNQLRLAALAPELGRAALAQVAEVGNG